MTVESRSALPTGDLIPASATIELGGRYHKPIPDRRRATAQAINIAYRL